MATWKGNNNYFQGPFVFPSNVHKKDRVRKQTWGYIFLKFLIILFQSVLFTKEFIECFGYILGYLTKLNRGIGLVSGANLQHIFYENCPYVIFHQLNKSHYQIIFTSQDVKQFVFKFLLEHIHAIKSTTHFQRVSPIN